MKAPAILRRHPEVVWLLTAALVVVLVVTAVSGISGAFRTSSTLSATSPEQLVDEVQSPHVGGYSGTISTRLALDLPPALSQALAVAVPIGGSLLRGQHTLRYWYGGATQQRVAIVGLSGEQDVFRNGSSTTYWDTYTRTAARTTTSQSADHGAFPLSLAAPAALTPPQLADQLLALTGDTDDITLRSGPAMLGRETYELEVRPDNPLSRIGEVRIEVDGLQGIPLSVDVYGRGAADPAIEVRFTTIVFSAPAARNFTFVAPEPAADTVPVSADAFAADGADVSRVGTGWLAVSSYDSQAARAAPITVTRVLGSQVQKVKGRWGSGRLLDTPMLCVLVTSTGRVLAGPVEPSVLYGALRD